MENGVKFPLSAVAVDAIANLTRVEVRRALVAGRQGPSSGRDTPS